MIIYLLRHAMAEFSEHAGSEPVLTAAGREQAEQLAIRLRGSDIRRFLSSPARRCLETLTPLVEATPGAEIESDPRLLEGATLSGILDVVESLEEEPSILCSHGDLIPELLGHFQRSGLTLLETPRCQKASLWIVKRSNRGWSARYLPPSQRDEPPPPLRASAVSTCRADGG